MVLNIQGSDVQSSLAARPTPPVALVPVRRWNVDSRPVSRWPMHAKAKTVDPAGGPIRYFRERRLTVARPLAEASLAPYLFAWASGLASISYLLLVMHRIAAAPGMLGVLILATLVFIGALMRAGMLVSRPRVADRRPLVHDRPLLAITLAWVVLVAVGSQMR